MKTTNVLLALIVLLLLLHLFQGSTGSFFSTATAQVKPQVTDVRIVEVAVKDWGASLPVVIGYKDAFIAPMKLNNGSSVLPVYAIPVK